MTIEEIIKNALNEDIGDGDHSSLACIPATAIGKVKLLIKEEGILAGIEVVKKVFNTVDNTVKLDIFLNDGASIKKGDIAFIAEGKEISLLMAERTVLNFMQRMSGIATFTRKAVKLLEGLNTKILDTRKTTPNFRLFEKYSVKVGGGSPHRFGLYDCIMIKDNHIQLAGSIIEAVKLVKQNISHTTKIEVETENFDQVKEALEAQVDIIMLDNMSVENMSKAVELINGRAITEASGNVSLETINKVASTGVDYISTSAINAKAGILDIGLDI